MNWRRLCGPTHQRVIDEYEVGTRAAKVWGWTDHYCPPDQYGRIRSEQNARASRPSPPLPDAQLELFAGAA